MGSLQPGAEAKTDWFKQMAKGEKAWRQPSGERSHSREVQLGTHNQVRRDDHNSNRGAAVHEAAADSLAEHSIHVQPARLTNVWLDHRDASLRSCCCLDEAAWQVASI